MRQALPGERGASAPGCRTRRGDAPLNRGLTPPARLLIALACLTLPACAQQMADHAGYKPLTPATFFDDGRSARPLVAGTVARGQLRTDTALHEGKDAEGQYAKDFPFQMTRAVLQRGRE